MTKFKERELLGQTLRKAGLISFAQIQVALIDQEYYQLRVGEILASRDWIKQDTADFFADEWRALVEQLERYPLGFYLEQSSLLTPEQTDAVLHEQNQLWIKFGSVAVIKGFIEQPTLDFFLKNLFPLADLESHSIGARGRKTKIVEEKANLNEPNPLEIDEEDIPWID